tara:strand:- start:1980 stop:2669 length:690 start_codon:yes stop_codon:yes gene_type:complete
MPFAFNSPETTLAIRGAPDKINWRSLFISGPPVANGDISLMLAADPSAVTTLMIGRTYPASGDVNLVINGSLGSGVIGASGLQAYPTLVISRAVEFDKAGDIGLYLDAPLVGSGTNVATLAIRDASLSNHSGVATIFVSGATTSASGGDNNNIGLIVKSNAIDDGNVTLYIDKDFNTSNDTSLHIRSGNSSGVITLATSGTNPSNAEIPLLIRPPTELDASFYIQGYSE